MYHNWFDILVFIMITIGLLISLYRLQKLGRDEFYVMKNGKKEYQMPRYALQCQTVGFALQLPFIASLIFWKREVDADPGIGVVLDLIFLIGDITILWSLSQMKATWKLSSTQ